MLSYSSWTLGSFSPLFLSHPHPRGTSGDFDPPIVRNGFANYGLREKEVSSSYQLELTHVHTRFAYAIKIRFIFFRLYKLINSRTHVHTHTLLSFVYTPTLQQYIFIYLYISSSFDKFLQYTCAVGSTDDENMFLNHKNYPAGFHKDLGVYARNEYVLSTIILFSTIFPTFSEPQLSPPSGHNDAQCSAALIRGTDKRDFGLSCSHSWLLVHHHDDG